MTEQVYYGSVVWFNEKRGIGFIKPDDEAKDYFVHWTNIIADQGKFKTLVAGQLVSFTVGSNKNGPQAENVTIMSDVAFDDE